MERSGGDCGSIARGGHRTTMKNAIPTIFCAAAIAAAAALAVQNRALRSELARAETRAAALPSAESAPPESAASHDPAPDAPEQAAPAVAPAPEAPPAIPAAADREAFEKAVEERAAARVEEIEKERRDEREARRREWENATEEEREAHRREFQARMQEHATAQITEFETKAGLDVEQCAAFEMELETFDARVREIAERFAVMVDGGVPFGFEMQTRIMNEMSAAVLDAYDGIAEVLPDGAREKGGEFNMMFGVSPSSLNSLFDAMRRSGAFGPRGPGPFGPFRGRSPRQ